LKIITAIVVVIGVMSMGLIIFGVFNIVVKKKKIPNMYTPFDDLTRGTNNTNSDKDLQEQTKYIDPVEKDESK